MGKVINRKLQGMSWWLKTSLVLALTLMSTIFMYEGWYKPRAAAAAITQLVAPTVLSGTASPLSVSFAVGGTASTNRMLIVGVAVKTTAVTGTETCSVTYGGTALTAIPDASTGSNTGYGHTFWFYMPENNTLMSATAQSLVVTLGGKTLTNATVWRAAYSGVDQTAPGSGSYASGTTAVSSTPLGTPLTINTGDRAFDIVNLVRSASTTARTLSTWATGWAIVGTAVNNTTTNGSNFYLGTSTTANSADSASHGASGITQVTAGGIVVPMLPTFKVDNGTNPSSGNAFQGNTGIALDAFTMKMGTGTATVNTLTFTGNASFINSNVSAVKVYRDNGTVGTLDGSDVLVTTTTGWATNVATITFTSAESVSTTAVNYLVVIDIAAAATGGSILSGTVTAATGTGLGADIRYMDTASANIAVKSAGLYVSENLGTLNATAPQSSLDNAMNGFKLYMGNASSTINTLTLTGSTQFTSANVAAIKVFRDRRGIGHVDIMDDLVPTTTSWASNVATITFTTPEAVTTTAQAYLIAVNMQPAATVGNTLSGTITAATGTGIGTVTYGDKRSATLTVAAGTALTIGNGTNPANSSAPAVSRNNALDAFTLSLAAGRGQVNTLTLTGSANLTTANVSGVRVFADNGTKGTLDRSDILIPTTYTHTGTAPVITFTTPEIIMTTVKNYLVVVDINTQPSVSVAATLTGTITAVSGSGYTSTTASDSASATLTIAKSNAASTSCASCHGYGTTTTVFADGSVRNTPTGNSVGSHNTHNGQYAYACSDCHVTPATETSADYAHTRGTIQMASPIHAETGAAYGKGTSWSYTDAPTVGQACTNLYCHSQGSGKTTQSGDTRSVSAPVGTLNWGASAADNCDSCHGFPPSYANGATTWGAAKANSHAVHSTECQNCHKATQADTIPSITNPANHANGVYNVISTGSSVTPRRSFTYTYAVTGGTCSNISCHGGLTAVWGTSIDCTGCHANKLRAFIARGIIANYSTRRNIVSEFAMTWSHKRSASGVVTKWDCIVCHMEGDPENGQADFDYHGNGYIELRDPDTGATIKNTSFSAAVGSGPGKFVEGATDVTFVKFSKNYAATNPEADAAFATQAAVQMNLCMKCHDSNGALSTLAQVPGGSALKPFATTVSGQGTPMPSYVTAGNVVNVFTSFSSGFAAYHPVRARANNSFTKNALMATGYQLTTNKAGTNTTSWGMLITCWDCHAPAGTTTASGTLTTTVTAHGAALTLRSPIRAGGNTASANLCLICHVTTYSTTSGFHPSGSAFGTGSGNMDAATMVNCYNCHAYTAASGTTSATQPRPLRGEDVHGVNERTAGTANSYWGGSGIRPVAFIRNSMTGWRPASVTITPTLAAGTASCGGTSGTCNNNMTYGGDNYTPGGSY